MATELGLLISMGMTLHSQVSRGQVSIIRSQLASLEEQLREANLQEIMVEHGIPRSKKDEHITGDV